MSTIDYTNNLFKEIDKRFNGKVSYSYNENTNRVKIGFINKLTADTATKLILITNGFERLTYNGFTVTENNEIVFTYSLKTV